MINEEKILELIKRKIGLSNNKTIHFSDFMQIALYDNSAGYYSTKKNIFGSKGDFYTASKISNLYGKIFSKQFKQIFKICKKNLLEFGAGDGSFAIETIKDLKQKGVVLDNYLIIEKSQSLQALQKENFAMALDNKNLKKISWIENIPNNFQGIVYLNEVFDSIPADIFIYRQNQLYEKLIKLKDNKLCWEIEEFFNPQFDYPIELSEDIEFEYSNYYKKLFQEFLKIKQGYIFIVDYGLSESELLNPYRGNGSLRCYFENRLIEDPFLNLGQQDITYNVNFTHLAFLSKLFALEIHGFISQSNFLNNLNIVEELVEEKDRIKSLQTQSEINLLTLPSEMGELVKMMVLGKNVDMSLEGFKNFDKTYSL
jgi:SAM-dependent MidA family methyltransferase